MIFSVERPTLSGTSGTHLARARDATSRGFIKPNRMQERGLVGGCGGGGICDDKFEHPCRERGDANLVHEVSPNCSGYTPHAVMETVIRDFPYGRILKLR